MVVALPAALPQLPFLLSLLVSALSDPLLVVLHHFWALVRVPEGSVLGRNGGTTMLTVEPVAAGALMVMQVVSLT